MTAPLTPTSDASTAPLRRNVRVVIFVLIVLCLFFVVGYVQRLAAKEAIKVEIAHLNGEIAAAKNRNALLNDSLQHIDEPAYVAAIARVDLGYIQPGDQPFVVIDLPTPPTPIAAPPSVAQPRVSVEPNWQRWLNLILPGPEPGAP